MNVSIYFNVFCFAFLCNLQRVVHWKICLVLIFLNVLNTCLRWLTVFNFLLEAKRSRILPWVNIFKGVLLPIVGISLSFDEFLFLFEELLFEFGRNHNAQQNKENRNDKVDPIYDEGPRRSVKMNWVLPDEVPEWWENHIEFKCFDDYFNMHEVKRIRLWASSKKIIFVDPVREDKDGNDDSSSKRN